MQHFHVFLAHTCATFNSLSNGARWAGLNVVEWNVTGWTGLNVVEGRRYCRCNTARPQVESHNQQQASMLIFELSSHKLLNTQFIDMPQNTRVLEVRGHYTQTSTGLSRHHLLAFQCWHLQAWLDYSWQSPFPHSSVTWLQFFFYQIQEQACTWLELEMGTNPTVHLLSCPSPQDLWSQMEKSLEIHSCSHLLLMARQPKFGDHTLYTLRTQSEDSEVFWYSRSIRQLPNYPPLLKRPKGVKSESVKYFSVSFASWPLLK